MEWINCNDEMPSPGRSVLCYDAKFNKIFVGSSLTHNGFIEHDWINSSVTHWMHLPEAPNKKGD